MAIHEYRCSKCRHTFEQIESITAEAHTVACPKCNGEAERIISHSAFQLKGSGWYSSGYESKPAASCPNADTSSSCSACAAATGADK
ncbi:hypothetical protein RsTz2092_08870 [Deferribacterales bacterium RsTz2092]|nr:hypothetical protein AGMMS49941_06220 [Deferribacterales bacterium]